MTWCITALILCLDTSHRTSSVDKPQYTRAYLSLKGGFSGVFFGTGLWQQLAVKPITHLVLIFLQLVFFLYLLCCNLGPTRESLWLCFYLLLVFLEIIVIIIIIIIIVLKKTTYLMLQNFQFKVSEVKINTVLLDTILSEHLI